MDASDFSHSVSANESGVSSLAPINPVLELNVISYDIHQDLGRPFCSYLVQCRHGAKNWSLEKRFSEFFALDQQLRQLVGKSDLLPPPLRKGLMLAGSDQIEQRKQLLNDYLHTLSFFITSRTSGIGSDGTLTDENEKAEKSYWAAVHAIYDFVRFVEFSSSADRVRSAAVSSSRISSATPWKRIVRSRSLQL
jgi:hypothetical protein